MKPEGRHTDKQELTFGNPSKDKDYVTEKMINLFMHYKNYTDLENVSQLH